MHTNKNILTLFALLVCFSGMSWFFFTNAPHIQLDIPSQNTEHRFKNLTINQFNAEGQRLYVLKAPASYHLHSEDTHYLTKPTVIVTAPSQPELTIQSQLGMIFPKGEKIQLLQQVHIQHSAYQSQAAGVIRTEMLQYFPQQKQVDTPTTITWDQGANHIDTTGMRAQLLTGNIELLDNVHGTYRTLDKTSFLTAKHVVAKLNQDNHLVLLSAYGHSKNKAHAWTISTDNQPALHSYADSIHYHPMQHQLDLIGRAQLKQGVNVLTAPHISYNTETDHFMTTFKNNEKTVVIIDPSQYQSVEKQQ